MKRSLFFLAVCAAFGAQIAFAQSSTEPTPLDADAIQARLDKLVQPKPAVRARAQCWIDVYRAERSETAFPPNDVQQRALFNADAIVASVEQGGASARNVRIYDTKTYPSTDERYGRPVWRAEIEGIERTLNAYDAKHCETPVSSCLDVAYEHVMYNMELTHGARWVHGRKYLDKALELASKAQSDVQTCPQPQQAATEAAEQKLVDRTLDADALFGFDQATLTPAGQAAVKSFADELNNQFKLSTAVTVVGYTDRFGTELYNLNLSQRRADAVKAALIANGVKVPITTRGAGAANALVQCPGSQSPATIACLQPNRRVKLTVLGKAIAKE